MGLGKWIKSRLGRTARDVRPKAARIVQRNLKPKPAAADKAGVGTKIDGKLGREAKEYLVSLAVAQVGVKEEGGNNRGAKIREYQSATWLDPAPWPWCAAFICWLFWKVEERYGLPYPRPRTAGAFDFARWARQCNLKILPEDAPVEPGDIIIFDFSHIGLAINYSTGLYVETVEGNTGPDGGRDGDGVWRKRRHRSLIKNIIRP